MASPMKIYPTVEECHIKNHIECPVSHCILSFTSESNLHLHLAKTHRVMDFPKTRPEKWFFCPIISCPWNSTKHFLNLKNLRQHYLKVHELKAFSCLSCNKSFATQALLERHVMFCNITFSCLDCNAFYASYETLTTHCRRKKHRLLSKIEYKTRIFETKSEVCLAVNKPLLQPKRCVSEHSIGVRHFRENIQTHFMIKPLFDTKTTQVEPIVVLQVTQHTQTGSKNNVCSVATQTDSENIIKITTKQDTTKDMNIQTDEIISTESSCNTSFNLEDFEFTYIEKNSSSTQTHWPGKDIFSTSTTTHGTIHTDTSDLLSDFDSNFFNCNSETQTELMFENEMFNSDYYSNMYTQTCDDILNGFNGFSDIQTQTVLHESLRSVESQTLMSSAEKLCPNILKDIVHSETQTDAELRHMLEIINS